MSTRSIQKAIRRSVELQAELRQLEARDAAEALETRSYGDLCDFGRCEWTPDQVEANR
jgi:hypothetical protein